jgi:peptidoglycan/xylan/chitin deacetylase (PgdA/CDA1 family)
VPALSAIGPLRRAMLPGLAGMSDRRHIALTFDDAPHAGSTPHLLDLLGDRGVTATFFVSGDHARHEPALLLEMVAAGHEVATHGWQRGCPSALALGRVGGLLVRSREVIEDLTGARVRWYRPPYGVLTAEGVLAAHRAELETVLWSASAPPRARRQGPSSIVLAVERTLQPGGTVRLHDGDRSSATRPPTRTLTATGSLLDRWAEDEVPVGALRDHWRE